jgi:hypothetical protein
MRFTLLALTVSLCACQKNNFPVYSLLGSLRVLTLQATGGPEVNPGASVTIQPVISDLNGGGRNLNVHVQTCVDPGIGLGVQPSCANPDSDTTTQFSSTTLGSNNTYTGLAPTFSVSVPNVTLPTPALQYNGVNYLVIYTISAVDGSSVTAFKRILVSDPSKTPKNQNPTFTSVSANGINLAASTAFSAATQYLVPTFGVGSESYQVMLPDGSLKSYTENVTTTWFISDGSMENDRTFGVDTNQWNPTGKPQSRDAVMVLVSHDGRGGEGFQILQFN